jgi:hypothetical protein
MLASAVTLAACTVNIGTSDSPVTSVVTDQTPTSIPSTTVLRTELDAQSSWEALVEEENAFASGDLSITASGTFGLMAAPTLRLFELIEGTWEDVTENFVDGFDIPTTGLDYDITIQSVRVTDDEAVDYVVNFRPAPWHVLDAPNQGRDHGTVISGQGGFWRSVAFYDPYGDGTEYTAVQHIEYLDGALLGDWFGSCGRPCGTLLYEWIGGAGRLEGEEAAPRQIRALQQPTCSNFNFNLTLPLELCNEGPGVTLVQNELYRLGYEIDADGYLGKGTRFVVQHYQRENGLRATGRVDEPTWRMLFEGRTLPGFDLNKDGIVTPSELSGM